jgi:Tfp pilus assembly protein PilP
MLLRTAVAVVIVMLLGASSPAEAQAAALQAKSSAEPAKAAPPSPGKPQPAAGKQTASPSGKVPAPKASQAAGASNAAAQPPTTDQLVEPTGFAYTPEGRRDPFVSLLRRGSSSRASAPSLRPPGLGGLSVEEITLRGTVRNREDFVGIAQGADQKTYIVRAGDKLLDGTIRTISQTEMVIVQQINDPLSLDKQREVRKVLRQIEAK